MARDGGLTVGNRRAIGLVAGREIGERVRDRSFLLSIAVFLGLIALFTFVPRVLGGPDRYTVGFADADGEALAAAVAEQAGDDAEVEVRGFDDAAAAESALEGGDVDAVLSGDEIVVDAALPGELRQLVQRASAQRRVYEGFAERGVGADQVTALLDPPPLPVRTLVAGADPDVADATAGFAAVVILVLYGQLLGYGIGVASGIVEEKQTRVVEVLLSTLRPAQLLAGKVLGIGLVGLLQLAIQAGLAFALVVGAGVFDPPPGTAAALAWTLTWFVLGYALYASAFAIVGALCARQEQLQNAATPLSLLILGSLFAAFAANNDPTSTVARVAGLLPPTAPMVMPVRLIRGAAAPWEVALAVGLVLAAIVALIALAGRVYSGGALQVTTRVRLRQALRAG